MMRDTTTQRELDLRSAVHTFIAAARPVERRVETTPLYAGESVARIHAVAHAYDVTRELAP